MRPLGAMILANLKMTVRNRAAIFWLIAFPVIFIVLFGYLLGGSDYSMSVGVANADTSPQSAQVVDQMKKVDSFKVKTGTQDEEMKALDKGDRDIVVVFEPGKQANQTSAQIYYDESNAQTSQVAVSAIQQFFSEANQSITNAPQPFVTSVQSVNTQNMDYIDFLVPGILAMSIMNNGLMGLSSTFVTYREKGILRRIKATPFPLWSFISARIITQVIVAVVQSAILLVVGKALFDLQINGDFLSLTLMLSLGAVAFLAIGFLISGIARNTEVADSVSNAIAFPMMFLSGVFFPIDAAPTWMKPITQIMPLTYFANGLRDIMIEGVTLFTVWGDVLIMLGTAGVALVLAVRFFRWEAQTA